jgi:TonB family protein
MTNKSRWLDGCRGCLILMLCLGSSASAQVSEVDYKTLYASADYDKALQIVAALDTIEAQQYKALCLLALGRQSEAGTAIEALVNSSPTFVPSSEEAPPRFVEMVTKVRQKLLPTIARRVFAEGRDKYTEKQTDEALKRFSLVLALLSDPAFTDANTKQDLETLAKGFIDLTNAAAPPVKAAAPAAPEPPSQEPQLAAAASSADAAPPKVTQPVALVQTVPPMPTDIVPQAGAKLVLVVQIDASGKVTGATVKEPVHPRYDRIVTLATREWRYTPATRNGVPIPSEQVVTVQIKR